MSDKILVAYTTAAGSTGEIAEIVGQVLADGGAAVDVRPTAEVQDLSPYRAVVVGTGIRAGNVYQKTLAFLDTHQQALGQVPVAYFVVCLTMKEDNEENRRRVNTYVDQMRAKAPQVKPVDVGCFGGLLDFKRLPLVLRLIMKMRKEQEGDYRDWNAIRAWASGVGAAL
ncbi:MAG: flavodoxin domain-containing protein [Anaerolineae bacterium]|jgi:menaquinone-dependent protoporphyrinogen oxidase